MTTKQDSLTIGRGVIRREAEGLHALAEVNGVISYANSLGNETIAITGAAQSTLARSVDTALILPDAPEACPNNLAPTTSTTLTLALGDALCVAVMQARGFTAEDFGARHPAGKLGFGLQRLGDYLAAQSDSVPLVPIGAAMPDVILAMTSGGKGCVGVTREDKLVGIITDGDLRRAMGADIMQKTASDIMTAEPFTLSLDVRMKDAVAAFTQRKIGNAFVLDGEAIIGLLDLKTILATGNVYRALAAAKIFKPDAEIILNLQGDAPFTDPAHIKAVVARLLTDEVDIATPAIQLSWEALDRLREAKRTTPFSGTTVIEVDGRAIWFSKNIIPAIRKETALREAAPLSPILRHIGLYGFRRAALERFTNLPQSRFETLEGLEQLRALENGLSIAIVKVEPPQISSPGIDTPEDLKRAEALIETYGDPFQS